LFITHKVYRDTGFLLDARQEPDIDAKQSRLTTKSYQESEKLPFMN